MYLLQETLFPARGLPEDLYLRINRPPFMRSVALSATKGQEPGLRLDERDVLSTDTYFGSFYRAYWQAHAPVSGLAVRLQFQGAGRLRICERTGRGTLLLAEQEIESDGARPILAEFQPDENEADIPAASGLASRIFVEVEAERPSIVRGLDFVSLATAPRRDVSLSIGLCTFNQERYFARTLDGIARLAKQEPALRSVYVVNQGAPFESEQIKALLSAPEFHPVAQRNLGGCGGFTRSLIEAQKADDPATHHLMMDDDIVLDERLIRRAIRFLSFTTDDIAIGGAMFDGLRPRIMYEAGAFLTEDNTVEAYCQNVDLSDEDEPGYFDRVVETDYNAWWFCILPLKRTREIGLPAPVFIRGDDFEYGQRLARDGVPTVTLPGVAVWHEPFYAKPGGWQDYYDLRNRLIFGATYGEKVRQLSVVSILGLLTKPCLAHNYQSTELRLKAVEDFLQGPDRLFGRDPETLHGDVMALAKANAPEKLDDDQWKKRPVTQGRSRPEGLRALALNSLSALLATGLLPLKRGQPVFMDADAHPGNTARRAYVMTNVLRSFHQRFTPDRRRLWALMWRVFRMARRYRRESGRVSASWADGIGRYQQPATWARLLDTAVQPVATPNIGTEQKSHTEQQAAE